VRPDRTSVYAQYTLISDRRDALVANLKAAGVPTAIHYPRPLDEQPAYKELCRSGGTPVSSRLAKQVFSLPMYADMDEATQQRITQAVHESLRQAA
jgi:UDP-2-acetamido-2-deoxy-ribo-hexuluronate aminotransferase